MSEQGVIHVDIVRESEGPIGADAEAHLEAARTSTYSLLSMWRSRLVADQPINKTYAPRKGEEIVVYSEADNHVRVEHTQPDGVRYHFELDGRKPQPEELTAVMQPVEGEPLPGVGDMTSYYYDLAQLLFMCDRVEARG